MLGQTPITLIGNLTDDPQLRYTPNGVAVATFTVASTERAMNRDSGKYEDSGTLFLRCNIWREQAEHLCESAVKGTRVVVTGTLKQRPWETKEGEKRTSYEVQAEEVATSLRWATAKVSKAARAGGPPPEDPWARTPGPGAADGPDSAAFTEEPPF